MFWRLSCSHLDNANAKKQKYSLKQSTHLNEVFYLFQTVNTLSLALSEECKEHLKKLTINEPTKKSLPDIDLKFSEKWEPPDLSYLKDLTPSVQCAERFSMAYRGASTSNGVCSKKPNVSGLFIIFVNIYYYFALWCACSNNYLITLLLPGNKVIVATKKATILCMISFIFIP